MVHRVLLVADDPDWRATCSKALAPVCEFEFAESETGALSALDRRSFSLALVSFRLKCDHGLSAVRTLTNPPHSVPVMVVTTLEDTDNRLAAYSHGAFAILYRCGAEELRMRVEKELARVAPAARSDTSAAGAPLPLQLGRAQLDVLLPRISVEGVHTGLSPTEHRILLTLGFAFETCVPRAVLAEAVDPDRPSADVATAVDNHLTRLRKKLADTCLAVETIKNVGYVLHSLEPTTVADRGGAAPAVRRIAPSGTHLRAAQSDDTQSTTAPTSWPPAKRAAKG